MKANSLTEAARRLNISQPAMSAILKNTEDSLGIKLFKRTGSRLLPTAEAIQLLPKVERVLGELESLSRFSRDLALGYSGHISITGSSALINTLIPSAMEILIRKYPGIVLRVETSSSPYSVERIVNQNYDLGLVYGTISDTRITTERVGQTRLYCVVPAHHRLSSQESVTFDDLRAEKVITFPIGASLRSSLEAHNYSLLDIAVEVNLARTACLLARKGIGVALVDGIVLLSPEYSDLVAIPFHPVIGIDISLIFPMASEKSLLIDQLVESLSGQINSQPIRRSTSPCPND